MSNKNQWIQCKMNSKIIESTWSIDIILDGFQFTDDHPRIIDAFNSCPGIFLYSQTFNSFNKADIEKVFTFSLLRDIKITKGEEDKTKKLYTDEEKSIIKMLKVLWLEMADEEVITIINIKEGSCKLPL